MENLKSLFKYSSDSVIITDYNFNILWFNKSNTIFSSYEKNCSSLFANHKQKLESGTYYISYSGLLYECQIINYPDCEQGVYVIQTHNEDIMYSFISHKGIKEVMKNQSTAIKEAINNISFSSDLLTFKLNETNLSEETKHINTTIKNCCKILKTITNTDELLKYIDEEPEIHRINISDFINQFILKSQNILKNKINIIPQIQPDIYIDTDSNHLTSFLLSLIILVTERNPNNNIINISLKQLTHFISLTISTNSYLTNSDKDQLTNTIIPYSDDEFNTDLYVVNRFCKTFNCNLFISEQPNQSRSFNIKFPYNKNNKIIPLLKSPKTIYSEGRFSKYSIYYSELF